MNTRVGVILGTGFNISIMMPEPADPEAEVKRVWQSYNTEIGSFGTNSSQLDDIVTSYDKEIQYGEMSIHKGEQILEKMITGKYLGELFR